MMMHVEIATVADPLFLSQAKLESWVEDGKVTFQDNVLTLLAEQVSYELAPAVKVVGLLDGADTAGLVGRVCALTELAGMAAEHYRDSLILGDTAYQCEEGFVGTEQAPAPPARRDPTPAPVEQPVEKSDMDLLTDFLLKNL